MIKPIATKTKTPPILGDGLLEEVERQMIVRTIKKTNNNKTRAAELLGISLKTLHNKLNLYRERGQLDDS